MMKQPSLGTAALKGKPTGNPCFQPFAQWLVAVDGVPETNVLLEGVTSTIFLVPDPRGGHMP